jgi:GNAT superfamily N-acetyltransferase
MPAPLVRRATLADADAIGLVHVRSWQSAYRGKIPQDYLDGLDPVRRSHVWRRIIGEKVSSIYAAPDAWGTGTGRDLMGSAVAELGRLGYADASLWVLDANERARRFYALAGWKPDGAGKTDTSRGFAITEVRYRRTLDGPA